MTEILSWTKLEKSKALGGAHNDLAVEAIGLIGAGAVDENCAVFLASANGQLLPGEAFAHIGHGDLLEWRADGNCAGWILCG